MRAAMESAGVEFIGHRGRLRVRYRGLGMVTVLVVGVNIGG